MLQRLQQLLQRLRTWRRESHSIPIETWEQKVAREKLIDAYLDPLLILIPSYLRTTLRAATAGLQNAPFPRDKILKAIAQHETRLRHAMDRDGANLVPRGEKVL